MKKTRNILWGLVLIALGVIISLNILNITDINIFFDGWWTLFIIVPSFIGLFKSESKLGNLIGLFIGVGLLLAAQDIIEFGVVFKLALPVILVCIGISLIFKKSKNRSHENVDDKINELNKEKKSSGAEDPDHCTIFAGQTLNFDGEVFTGADLTAVFGGIKCDLRGSIITGDVVINASSVFGGITINVPDNVNVKIKSSSVFGGVSSQKEDKNDDSLPTVYIKAECMFGGVSVL